MKAPKTTCLLLMLLLAIYHCASAGQIAITIDDAPRPDSSYYTGSERTKIIIEKLVEAKVPQAMFFATGKNICTDNGRKRIKEYANSGHLIANHSYEHLNLDKVGDREYSDDILKNQKIIKDLPNLCRYFRYPFLHEGNTVEKRDCIRAFLKKHNLKNGYVTVDNWDWFIDRVINKSKSEGKKINLENLKKLYIDHVWSTILFYDSVAVKYLGRSPKHTLLLHDNDATALFVADLANHIRENGWEIIPPIEAYQDPIADYTPETLMNNQGKVMAIAIDKGYKGPYSSGEDEESIIAMFEKYKVWE